MRQAKTLILLFSGMTFIIIAVFILYKVIGNLNSHFDGVRAYNDVITQVGFGPRIPDSSGHSLEIEYIQKELHLAGWETSLQDTTWKGFDIQNIIAYRTKTQPQFILGTHYDTRLLADQDLFNKNLPVPGANDGASGVAVLLEIARTLPTNSVPIWLVFFDAEDNGGINGREWIMGSKAFVAMLGFRPEAAIIVDMVGDINPDYYYEANSDIPISESIWTLAVNIGYRKYFIPKIKYSILDDHTAFLEDNIRAIDIIDFDYPYWHTSEDTVDKVSAQSLSIIGVTLENWLSQQK